MLTVFVVLFLSTWRVEMVLTIRNQCPEEVSPVDGIQGLMQAPRWPQTFAQIEVYSDPLCFSKDFHLIRRECAETWIPAVAPKCYHVSTRKPKHYCPPGYTVVKTGAQYVCLTISEEKWSNTCRFSPKAFDDMGKDLLIATLKHLQKRGTNTTWLPIKRLDSFGPLLWTIPGPLWSSRFDASEELEITYGDRSKTCVVLDVSQGFQIKAESCSADHPFLCIVEENYFVRGACPSKYYAAPTPGDERCFRLIIEDNINWREAVAECPTAQIDNPIIEQLFSGLAKRRGLTEKDYCWIGGNGRYRSNTMAMNVAGELKNFDKNTNLNCVFCQIDTPPHSDTEISLKFDKNEGQLLLSVYGEEGLWKLSSSDPGIRCFTNANGDLIGNVEIRKIWDKRWTEKDIEPDIDFEDSVDLDVDIHKTIYRVKLSKRGPGFYICEGHTNGGQLLKTKQVIAYRKLEGNIFALGLDVKDACQNVEKCDPTFLKIYHKLAKDLEEATVDRLIQDIRTMQILDITSDGNVSVLFHVTAEQFDDEEFDHESMKNAYRRTKRLFQLLVAVKPRVYDFLFLNSCAACLKSVTGTDQNRLVWPYTPVGKTAVSEEICLDSTGLPVYRICKGNFMMGGAWSEPSGTCASEVSPSTQKLYDISKDIHESKTQYNRELANKVLGIVENTEQLTCADIYFLSKIIDYESKSHKAEEVVTEDLSRTSFILNKVMNTNANILRESQILNSTDILLDSLSTLLDLASVNISTEYLSEGNGSIIIVRSHLIIYILDPNMTSISGLALIQNSSNSTAVPTSFLDYSVVPLIADDTIEDVAKLGDVEVATWLPRNLLDVILTQNDTSFNNSLENTTTTYNVAPRIVITLFYNDIVFTSDLPGHNNNKVNSRVVSVSVPGYGMNLPFPIPILFKPLKGTSVENRTCAYWDFDYVGISTAASLSAWSEDGCQNSGRTRDISGELNVCLCSHLTHFAQLVLGHFPNPEDGRNSVSVTHSDALEMITIIGCVLSLVGVFGILITATVFRTWRKKPGSKVLIQLSLALGLEKFTIGILQMIDSAADPIPCIITAAVLHYSILAEFSWMLITAWLQFKRYVTVLGATRPPRFLLKAAAFAWGVPLIIVTIVASIDPYAYMPAPDSGITYCQVSGIAQYASLLAPVIFVICLNTFLFVRVIISVLGTRKKGPRIEDDKTLIIAQLRLGIMLFFLLGITWVFGLIARIGGGLLFSYLFCITAALQGFVLFMFFIICDPATRNLWYSFIKLGGKLSSSVTPSISASSGISESSQRY